MKSKFLDALFLFRLIKSDKKTTLKAITRRLDVIMPLLQVKKEPSRTVTYIFVFISIIIYIIARKNAEIAQLFLTPVNRLEVQDSFGITETVKFFHETGKRRTEVFSLTNPRHYLRLFLHPFGNSSILMLVSNAVFLLFCAPFVESKISKPILIVMFLITALVSASCTVSFFSQPIQGGTGIVFLYLLISLIDMVEKHEFSVVLVLIVALFLLREFYHAIDTANLSGFTHLIGALVASALIFIEAKATTPRRRTTRKIGKRE